MTLRQVSVLIGLQGDRRAKRLRDMAVAARAANIAPEAFEKMLEKLEDVE